MYDENLDVDYITIQSKNISKQDFDIATSIVIDNAQALIAKPIEQKRIGPLIKPIQVFNKKDL